LPALAKIHNKQLVLSGYKLNKGVCKAMKKGLKLIKNAVSKVVLDNNGLDDNMMGCLLKGINN
jgi:hypothetical protein